MRLSSQRSPAPRYRDRAAGLKPAQPNLTQVFLQIADSLTETGSPEGYIRHMQNEHARISTKFASATGQSHTNRLPAHMTPEYLDRLISNWNALSPKLGLDALAMEAGRCARKAIRGTDGNGTVVIKIFNEHQDLVVDTMEGGISKGADFEHLKSRLEAELGLLAPKEAGIVIAAQQEQYFALLARNEKALSAAERQDYVAAVKEGPKEGAL